MPVKKLMKSTFAAILLSATQANIITGQACLDNSLAVTSVEPGQVNGQWFEVYRNKGSLIEKDGKCNSSYIGLFVGGQDLARIAAATGKKVTFGTDHKPIFKVINTQESTITNDVWTYDGVIACAGETGDCMIDFGEPAGNGIVGRANMLLLGADPEKWSLIYACN